MLATELYSASFRCPECGELYGGGLSLSRIHKRGCCAYCGLRLFKKDTINWRLE
jgi:DNA-directed RNA polymerase subunit RPC12/RpoP